MATAGYPIKVYAKASNAAPSAGDEIDGLNDASYEELIDLLETTSFKSGSAAPWKVRIAGLNDGSISLNGDYVATDAPQVLIKTSKRSGADIWITVQFAPGASAGSKGFQAQCKVEKFGVKDSIAGKTEFSSSFKFTGAVTDV